MSGIQEKQMSECAQNAKVHTGTKKRLTQARLRELFSYDDGNLIRKISTCNCTKVGDIAGNAGYNGYSTTMIDRKTYYNHRLIWLHQHGYYPENDIDHIDRNRSNNKIENLREVSRSCNSKNTGNRSNNISGVKGVHWGNHCGKWMARIMINYKNYHLGIFKDFDEAVCHRLAAEQCLDWDGCNSTSPAYKHVKKII